MLVIENKEARIEWRDEVIFSTMFSTEIQLLEAIKNKVNNIDYWNNQLEGATESEQLQYSLWADNYQREAKAMCESLNILLGLNAELKWFMF